MPLPQLTAFLINGIKRSIQTELIDFSNFVLDDTSNSRTMTASALCQARRHFHPEALHTLLLKQYQQIREQISAPTWLGYQLFAIVRILVNVTVHSGHRDRCAYPGVTRLNCNVIGHEGSMFFSFLLFFCLSTRNDSPVSVNR